MLSTASFVNSLPRSVGWWIFIIQLITIAAISGGILVTDVNRIRTRATGDFEHFYYAADAVRHGTDPYAAWTRGYIYPPLIAFVFQPLSYLGRDRAAAVMLAVNVAVTLLTLALAADEFLRRFGAIECLNRDTGFQPVRTDLTVQGTVPRWKVPGNGIVIAGIMLMGMLLDIDKVKGEWQMWQTDVFMLLLFVLALRWIDRLPLAAGIALGIAINIKYLPLLFLPYLLLRRRWGTSAGLIAGTILFALLPAVSTGWSNNLRNWNTAANGLLQMADLQSQPTEAAEVHDVRDSLSCSITSAFARAAWNAKWGFALAAVTVMIGLTLAIWMYHHRGFSLLSPSAADRHDPGITGLEWVMLVAVVLAFGPQTNTRHLYDALILTTAASVLLVFAKPATNRWPLLIGITVLFLGFILPFGRRSYHGERTPAILWLRIGGPCWCLLIAAFTLLWTGLSNRRNGPSRSLR